MTWSRSSAGDRLIRHLVEDEPGSEVCLRVCLQAETVVTVRSTSAEARDSALVEFESVLDQMDVPDVDDDLVRQAGALARTHALPDYDAVHCASGLRVRSATTVGLAGDRQLLAAWHREGLQAIDTGA